MIVGALLFMLITTHVGVFAFIDAATRPRRARERA